MQAGVAMEKLMPAAKVPCSIEYEPSVDVDRLGDTNQSDMVPVSPGKNFTLARREETPGAYQLYFHGNSQARAFEGERDVSGDYLILRRWRQWDSRPQGPITSVVGKGYQMNKPGSGVRGFVPDSGNRKSWNDAPGIKQSGKANYTSRTMYEFVAGVCNPGDSMRLLPAFGGLHYYQVIDITPEKYRVIMTFARSLTSDQTRGVMGEPKAAFPSAVISPSMTPETFKDWAYVMTDWIEYTKWLT